MKRKVGRKENKLSRILITNPAIIYITLKETFWQATRQMAINKF